MDMHFKGGLVAFISYVLFIPESPRWLFQKEGPKSQNGINTLNYIAMIN
jgi:hypothetical protein